MVTHVDGIKMDGTRKTPGSLQEMSKRNTQKVISSPDLAYLFTFSVFTSPESANLFLKKGGFRIGVNGYLSGVVIANADALDELQPVVPMRTTVRPTNTS